MAGTRNVHRITPEWLAGVVTYFEAHGLKKTASHYNVAEAQARRYLMRAADEGLYAGEIPQAVSHPRAASNGAASSIATGRKLGQYLDALAAGETGEHAPVALGQIPGLPAWTRDPAVVRQAVAYLTETKLAKAQGLAALRLRQRLRDLEYAAEELETEKDDSLEQHFIAHAAEYAEQYGIEYGTFRDAGVPARVLKAAGITR